jgi:hypothetical protein
MTTSEILFFSFVSTITFAIGSFIGSRKKNNPLEKITQRLMPQIIANRTPQIKNEIKLSKKFIDSFSKIKREAIAIERERELKEIELKLLWHNVRDFYKVSFEPSI